MVAVVFPICPFSFLTNSKWALLDGHGKRIGFFTALRVQENESFVSDKEPAVMRNKFYEREGMEEEKRSFFCYCSPTTKQLLLTPPPSTTNSLSISLTERNFPHRKPSHLPQLKIQMLSETSEDWRIKMSLSMVILTLPSFFRALQLQMLPFWMSNLKGSKLTH